MNMTEPLKQTTHLDESGRDIRKCKIHNMWMRKGECSVCYVDKRKQQLLDEQKFGSNKPAIKITKI